MIVNSSGITYEMASHPMMPSNSLPLASSGYTFPLSSPLLPPKLDHSNNTNINNKPNNINDNNNKNKNNNNNNNNNNNMNRNIDNTNRNTFPPLATIVDYPRHTTPVHTTNNNHLIDPHAKVSNTYPSLYFLLTISSFSLSEYISHLFLCGANLHTRRGIIPLMHPNNNSNI